VAHSYFSQRIDDHALEIERYANMLIHKLYAHRPEADERLHLAREEVSREP
jgi:hypothetical protein